MVEAAVHADRAAVAEEALLVADAAKMVVELVVLQVVVAAEGRKGLVVEVVAVAVEGRTGLVVVEDAGGEALFPRLIKAVSN